jgi:hypothetical protein
MTYVPNTIRKLIESISHTKGSNFEEELKIANRAAAR